MQHSKLYPLIGAWLVSGLMLAAAAGVSLNAVVLIPTAQAASTPTTGDTSGTLLPTTGDTGSGNTQTASNGSTLANPLKFNSLNDLLTAVLKAVIQIGTIVLTLALIYVGFRFIAARGNEEKIRSARTALMWTVIGGLILLGATAIQAVITSTVSSITT
jgi:hypothetical protein